MKNIRLYIFKYPELLSDERIVFLETAYEVNYQGKNHHIAITVSSNGFIIGANPTKVGSK